MVNIDFFWYKMCAHFITLGAVLSIWSVEEPEVAVFSKVGIVDHIVEEEGEVSVSSNVDKVELRVE